MLFAGPPFCTGYALHTYRSQPRPTGVALLGLILAGTELLILVILLIAGLVASFSR